MKCLFYIIGVVCSTIGVAIGLIMAVAAIIVFIKELLYRRKYKNRFKKKPTAA